MTGVLSLTIAGLTIAQGRAPVALIGAATMVVLFWNGRAPILFADAVGIRLGHRRCVPWSDVAKLSLHPLDGWNHPVELLMHDGTRRPLLRDLDPTDVRRLKHLLAASRRDGRPRPDAVGPRRWPVSSPPGDGQSVTAAPDVAAVVAVRMSHSVHG